ncbi:hypothetical protein [Chryseobacterium sp. CFBP8996]|uniref:hypothetical protein n=1 Tax=Chryseobacterium sp. CFBP8996 TaxID=3096529 RepID=UPI002A69994F|nr:hypothetical protein [Chryseobacterium sp. CFBP8996]MDY0933132.1 hypothetical protein [Chryseobacterium sp. CFBP8996]
MIAPEYFNNHVSVEGEIIVKSVPNDAGFVLVWNTTTKKISRRTHTELISDLNLVTSNQLGNYWQKYDDGSFRGIDDDSGANFSFLTNGGVTAKKINTGGLLTSDVYSDQQYIPTNGIYSKGNIATLNYGSAVDWAIAATWTQTQGATMNWVTDNFVTLNTPQNITARKSFSGATGNSYDTSALEVRGDGSTIYPSIGFHQPGLYAGILSYRTGGFYFMDLSGNGYSNVSALGFYKSNSSDDYFLTGGGGHKFIGDFLSNDKVSSKQIGIVATTLDAELPNGGFVSSYYSNNWSGADKPNGASYGGYIKFSAGAGDSNNLDFYYNNGHNGDASRLWFRTKEAINGTKPWMELYHTENLNPVRLGGSGTSNNPVYLGWTGTQLQIQVDNSVIGNIWHTENLNPVTLDTEQSIEGAKWFRTAGGNQYLNHRLRIRSEDGSNPGMVFYKSGHNLGTIQYNGDSYLFTNSDTNLFASLVSAGYIKEGSNDGYVLLGGGGHIPVSSFASGNYISYQDNREINPSEMEPKKLGYGFTTWNNNNNSPYADYLHFGGYQDDSGGRQNLIVFRKNGFGIRQFQDESQSTDAYSDFVDYWHTGALPQSHVDYLANLTNVGAATTAMLADYIPLTQKAVPNGIATLDGSGLVPATQLPSYVDDVLEFNSLNNFPTPGETGKIYVETDTNHTYRWSGSTYIQIASGAVQSVNGQTGIVNVTKADVGLGNVDNTSDVNKPISTATQTALDEKENSFSKNTAFNKNFGATTGTVAEGNDSRINNGQIAYNWGNHQAINEGQYLGNAGQYTINSDTSIGNFPQGIASYFVQADSVYPSYGSLLNIKTYNGGGGTLQLYTPYSTQYGGDFIKYRRYNYGTEVWSELRGFWDTGHFSPTDLASWKNLAEGNSTGYIRTDTLEQTKTGKLTLASGLAIPDQEKIYLAGYANTTDYVTRFADAFVGFSISNGFSVKHYINGADLFKVDDEGNIHNAGAAFISQYVNTPKLIANYPSSTSGQNLGSAGVGSTLELRNYNAYGTNFWTDDSGQGYIQQQRFDGNPISYRLNLQPLGGELFYGDSEVAKQSWVNANDKTFITDSRGAVRPPSFYDDRYAQWDFQYTDDTQVTGDAWQGVLTVAKWSTFDPSHRQEQLLFTGDNLKRRTAIDDDNWGPEKTIWDSGNFTPANFATTSQLNDKVNKSGDTMTGALLIGNNNIGKQRVLHLAEPTYLDSYGFNFYTDTSTGSLTLHGLNNGLNNAAPILSANRANNFVGINKENATTELDVNGNVTSNGFIKNNSSDDYFLMGSGGQLTKYSKDDSYVNSHRDFPDGTLITTNIDYSHSAGDSFLLEIKGNMYGGGLPMDTKVQGYIYADTIINQSGYSTYADLTTIVAMNINGNLCFWFPRLWYWQGFSVKVIATGGGDLTTINRVISIDNSPEPAGTKHVKIKVHTLSTQTWVNDQGFLTSANLNGYVTQSSLNNQLGNYATLNGVQTFNNTNTFNQSPVIPNGTLGTHAVNLNQLLDVAPPYHWNYVGHSAIANRRVLSEMTWNNYGNNHTIFDISSGTTPWGASKSNVDAEQPWSPSYPTLVGGNGSGTYGLRVDSARNADNLGGISAGSYATQTWVNTNYIPRSHPVFNITQANINSWNAGTGGGSSHTHFNLSYLNNIDQYLGTGQDPQFGSIKLMDSLGYGLLALEEGLIGGEIGLVDTSNKRFYAGRINEYLKYGSSIDGFEGLNMHFDAQLLCIGREIGNDEDKVQLAGDLSVDTIDIYHNSMQLILNPLYNTDGDVRRSRNAHIYIVTREMVRLPQKPILGQRIEIFNDSDSYIEVTHDNVGTMFKIPGFCKVTGIVANKGFKFDAKPVDTKQYDI